MTSIQEGTEEEHEQNYWVKASGRDLTAAFPFFSKDGCLDALQHLRDAHILIKGTFNQSRFDHTYWHAFTRYGYKVMLKEMEVQDYDGTGKETKEHDESVRTPILCWCGY
ncbi:MAG: hypothetical protein IJM83_10745 [Firmicutes bacterium]|nr:hypothetical protein [Bacillota bacterium]